MSYAASLKHCAVVDAYRNFRAICKPALGKLKEPSMLETRTLASAASFLQWLVHGIVKFGARALPIEPAGLVRVLIELRLCTLPTASVSILQMLGDAMS